MTCFCLGLSLGLTIAALLAEYAWRRALTRRPRA
jgi:hypothetical protein